MVSDAPAAQTPPADDGGTAPLPPAPEIGCWRCGKSVPATSVHCPWCHADVHREPAPGGAVLGVAPRRWPRPPLVSVVIAFAILLATNAAIGVISFATSDEYRPRPLVEVTAGELVLEGIWTAVCALAIILLPKAAPLPPRPRRTRIGAWLVAAPTLAVLLVANLLYHWVLASYIGGPWLAKPDVPKLNPLNVGLAIASVCIQPAVIEELFFRYLALGTLHSVAGAHTAVVVSSIMFGAAHIGAPLSVPMLTLVGLALGYLRLTSGSLLLPMLLHGLHNGIIMWLEVAG